MNLDELKNRFATPWSRIRLALGALLIMVTLVHVPAAVVELYQTDRSVRSLERRINQAEAMESTIGEQKAALKTLRNEHKAFALDLGENRISAIFLFLSQAAERENVLLNAVKPGTIQKSDNPDRLHLDVEATARFHGLGHFVQRIEASKFGLRVEGFRMTTESPVSGTLKIRLRLGVPCLEGSE